MTADSLVTIKESAEVLGVAYTTLARWCRLDPLPVNRRVGRAYLVRLGDVAALVASRRKS